MSEAGYKNTPGQEPLVKWKPTTGPFVRVNFDASFDASSGEGGIGVVRRNNEGLVMGAYAAGIQWVADSFVAEAKAAVKALELAFDLGSSYTKLCTFFL
ncbi:hypothetical protein DITRI_Ditri02bG0153300 [Diplodiscus trichospermus]